MCNTVEVKRYYAPYTVGYNAEHHRAKSQTNCANDIWLFIVCNYIWAGVHGYSGTPHKKMN